MTLAVLDNEIMESEYKRKQIPPMFLEGNSKVEHDNEWQTYHERNSQLQKQSDQAFSMIQGKCMQVLLDKMDNDPDWDNTSESYNPLIVLKLIEKIILAQTEDQC